MFNLCLNCVFEDLKKRRFIVTNIHFNGHERKFIEFREYDGSEQHKFEYEKMIGWIEEGKLVYAGMKK